MSEDAPELAEVPAPAFEVTATTDQAQNTPEVCAEYQAMQNVSAG